MSDLKRIEVSSKNVPPALGQYIQAIISRNHIFVPGQLGIDPKTGSFGDTIAEQTLQALLNIQSILSTTGTTIAKAVKITIFLKNMSGFQNMNEVYGTFSQRVAMLVPPVLLCNYQKILFARSIV